MQFSDTEVIGQQIAWGMERLPHDGVAPDHVLHRFQILAETISTLLPAPHAQAANQYLYWMITEQQKRMAMDE
jgi:hypothetical protein